MIGIVGLFHLMRLTLFRIISYQLLITISSLAYLIILFPKPLQLIGLTGYLYAIYYFIGRRTNYKGLLLPIILLSLPMITMKFTNIIPSYQGEEGMEKLLPLIFQIAGISYMTFKSIQMYIDERDSVETASFIQGFNFLTFVPTLLIGPIDRYKRFNTDVAKGYSNVTGGAFIEGMDKLALGLLYKFAIAEAIRRLVLTHLIDDGTIWYHLGYMYTYLFYLFFDFAGYSLLAIGFGRMLGIEVPINFDKPFSSRNPKEFWQKWHRSLGLWLNDYFFKPIFKYLTSNKIFKSIQRQNIALFATFTLMGFWNGFELHFILSGMIFGLYSVVHNYYVYLCKKKKRDVFFGKMSEFWIRILSIFILFNGVAFAIYIFSGSLI